MLEGTVIGGRYAISRILGEGGMGCVYEARHLGTGRKVALKVISSELATNASVIARLEAEAQAAGSIDSDHITQVVDVGRDEETATPYLVMELLDGEDLGDLLARLGPLEPTLVARIAVQIAMGLEAAHARNIVHRDLKPANIFMSRRDGGEVKVKILDFGISKSLAADDARPQSNKLTKTGTIMGSPVYMSPEQTRAKNIDHRSDLWSFGVVIYELLTSTTPFDSSGAIADLIIDICTGQIPPVSARAPWTPAPLAAVVERALVRDPAQRWQSAREMRAALEACLPEVRAMRTSDLVGSNRTPLGTPAHTGGVATGASTPVGAPGGAAPAASGPVAVQTALAMARPAAVATVAYERPAEGIGRVGIAAPVAAAPPKKGSSMLPIVAGVVVLGGLGVGGFMLTRGGSETGSTSASTSGSAAGAIAPPPASQRVAETTPSALESVAPAVRAVDPVLAALAGRWVSAKGNHYDAIVVDDAVEFRVRDPKEFVGQGYAAGEKRFALRVDKPGSFTVLDHVRVKLFPGNSYTNDVGPPSCAIELTTAAGAPLVAKMDGDRLVVGMAALSFDASVFVLQGGTVERCTGLDKITPTRIESTYTREK